MQDINKTKNKIVNILEKNIKRSNKKEDEIVDNQKEEIEYRSIPMPRVKEKIQKSPKQEIKEGNYSRVKNPLNFNIECDLKTIQTNLNKIYSNKEIIIPTAKSYVERAVVEDEKDYPLMKMDIGFRCNRLVVDGRSKLDGLLISTGGAQFSNIDISNNSEIGTLGKTLSFNVYSNTLIEMSIDPNKIINSLYPQIQCLGELCLTNLTPLTNATEDEFDESKTHIRKINNLLQIKHGKYMIQFGNDAPELLEKRIDNNNNPYWQVSKFLLEGQNVTLNELKCNSIRSTSANNSLSFFLNDYNTQVLTINNQYSLFYKPIKFVAGNFEIGLESNNLKLSSNDKTLYINKPKPINELFDYDFGLRFYDGTTERNVLLQDTNIRVNTLTLLQPGTFNVEYLTPSSSNENYVLKGNLQWGSVNLSELEGFTNNSSSFLTGTGTFRSILSSDISDLLTYLTNNVSINQLSPPNNNLNMNNYRITSLQDPINNTDAVTKIYCDNLSSTITGNINNLNTSLDSIQNQLSLSNSVVQGVINSSILNLNLIPITLIEPALNQSGYLYSAGGSNYYKPIDILDITNALISNNNDLSMENKKIINLATPTHDNDAANKIYVDSIISSINMNTTTIQNQVNITQTNVNTLSGYFQNEKLPVSNIEIGTGFIYSDGVSTFYSSIPSSYILTALSQINQNISVNNNKIINLSNPVNSLDAVNKQYLDGIVNNLQTQITSNYSTLNTINSNFTNGKLLINNIQNGTGYLYSTGASTIYKQITEIDFQNALNSVTGQVFDFGSNKITGVSNPSNSLDLVNKIYVDNNYALLDSYILVLQSYFNSEKLKLNNLTGGGTGYLYSNNNTPYYKVIEFSEVLSALATASSDININNNKIINLSNPVNNNDAANKIYVDTNFNNSNQNISNLNTEITTVQSYFTSGKLNLTNINTTSAPLDTSYLISNSGIVSWSGTNIIPTPSSSDQLLISTGTNTNNWTWGKISPSFITPGSNNTTLISDGGVVSWSTISLSSSLISGVLPISKLDISNFIPFKFLRSGTNSSSPPSWDSIYLTDIQTPVIPSVALSDGISNYWGKLDLSNTSLFSGYLPVSKIAGASSPNTYLSGNGNWVASSFPAPTNSNTILITDSFANPVWSDTFIVTPGQITFTSPQSTSGITIGELVINGNPKSTFSSTSNHTHIFFDENSTGIIGGNNFSSIANFYTIDNSGNTSLKCYIDNTGNIINLSDENVKHSFRLKSYRKDKNYLQRILDLPIYSFCYKNDDPHINNKVQVGCKAQDIIKLFNNNAVNVIKFKDNFKCEIDNCEFCSKTNPDIYYICPTTLIFYIILAIQEYYTKDKEYKQENDAKLVELKEDNIRLDEQCNLLQSEINNLESELTMLDNRIKLIEKKLNIIEV